MFEIDCRFVVRAGEDGPDAWHALRVEIDGALQWTRRIATHSPQDSLDHHCRREVQSGAALRVRALTQVGTASVRSSLVIEAEEASR